METKNKKINHLFYLDMGKFRGEKCYTNVVVTSNSDITPKQVISALKKYDGSGGWLPNMIPSNELRFKTVITDKELQTLKLDEYDNPNIYDFADPKNHNCCPSCQQLCLTLSGENSTLKEYFSN